MAIALPLHEEELERPWPRPVLRLVTEREADLPLAVCATTGPPDDPMVKVGTDVAARRRARAARRVRRRRLAVSVLVGALLVLLALPVSLLGGRAVTASPPVRPVAATGAGVTYVVQPGDTLWSIATGFDRGGDPRALVSALASELGSETVFPGERIRLP